MLFPCQGLTPNVVPRKKGKASTCICILGIYIYMLASTGRCLLLTDQYHSLDRRNHMKINNVLTKLLAFFLISALFFQLFFVRMYLQSKIDFSLKTTRTCYKERNLASAKSAADELLRSCSLYHRVNLIPVNYWNYGNAIHDGHSILGLIALSDGNIQLAKEHLISAGNTPGSPQLDTFGPKMILAEALLDKGEKAAVIEYLKECSRFWEDQAKLREWINAINKGEIPVLNKCK
jgi:hypothetical protein